MSGANAVTAVLVTTETSSSGSYSLKAPFANASQAEVGVQICAGGVDLYGYVLNFDFYSPTFSGWMVAIAWNANTKQWGSAPMLYTETGLWKDFHGTLGGDNSSGAHFNATHIGIYWSVDGAAIQGTGYVDNIYLSH